MSLQHNKDKQYCECDECGTELLNGKGNTFQFARDEFDVFLEQLSEQGWRTVKDGAYYRHICSDCQDV